MVERVGSRVLEVDPPGVGAGVLNLAPNLIHALRDYQFPGYRDHHAAVGRALCLRRGIGGRVDEGAVIEHLAVAVFEAYLHLVDDRVDVLVGRASAQVPEEHGFAGLVAVRVGSARTGAVGYSRFEGRAALGGRAGNVAQTGGQYVGDLHVVVDGGARRGVGGEDRLEYELKLLTQANRVDAVVVARLLADPHQRPGKAQAVAGAAAVRVVHGGLRVVVAHQPVSIHFAVVFVGSEVGQHLTVGDRVAGVDPLGQRTGVCKGGAGTVLDEEVQHLPGFHRVKRGNAHLGDGTVLPGFGGGRIPRDAGVGALVHDGLAGGGRRRPDARNVAGGILNPQAAEVIATALM